MSVLTPRKSPLSARNAQDALLVAICC
ncbi:hypothetical protein CTRU02_214177 [Colletotrichum truncatum]|uniref:Uncharacterized protein n=1 Tax=Colletotrichum truncatum TaxID=5467 RepID=A0ACC3YJR9_COLTU|nr:hypothetical protein CTRU02_11257 [Colletotrichum truncatum]